MRNTCHVAAPFAQQEGTSDEAEPTTSLLLLHDGMICYSGA